MPWFSKKKKRKNKKVDVNTSKDDTVVTTTSQPLFLVVVQDFEALISDQISVERGQVVESLSSEDNWIYIRNVDGNCGYIPADFCFPLEKLRMGLPDNKNGKDGQLRVHPRPTTIHVDTFEHPSGEDRGGVVNRGGEGEEEEVNSPDSGISCSQQASSSNMESVQSFHNVRERSGTGTKCELDQSHSRQQALDEGARSKKGHTHVVKNSRRHKHFVIPNPSLPVLETAPPGSNANYRGHPDAPHSPSPPPLQPVNLADARQKASTTAPQLTSESGVHVACGGNVNTEEDEQKSNAGSSDGDDVFLPEANKPVGIYQCAETYEPKFEGEMPLQKDEIVVVMEVGRGEWVWAVGSECKEGLVPKALLHKYRPDVPEEEEEEEGRHEEEGEDVAESEGRRTGPSSGMSEGATSTPAAAVYDTATSATQTELIVNGAVQEILCSVPLRHAANDAVALDTATVSIQTEFTSPTWFKNNTPSTTPNHTLTRSTTSTVTGTTPHPHPHQHRNTHTPSLTHPSTATPANLKLLCNPRSSQSSQNSPTTATANDHSQLNPPHTRTASGSYLPLVPVSTQPTPSISVHPPNTTTDSSRALHTTSSTLAHHIDNSNDSAVGSTPSQTTPNSTSSRRPPSGWGANPSYLSGRGTTGTLQRHRQALRQHTRIVTSIPFEPDNEPTTSRPQSVVASRRRMQPTPIVTAVRHYTPPRQAKNALALRKGDIMYAQLHVPFPHGWVWVYHTLLKKYGYVPKDCIAYMYLVQKDQTTVLEDIV